MPDHPRKTPTLREQLYMGPHPPPMDIKPPKNIVELVRTALQERNTRSIVRGFPLSTAWSESRSRIAKQYDSRMGEPVVISNAIQHMKIDCRKVWPASTEWLLVKVDQEGYGCDWANFFSFGFRNPPPDVVERLKSIMARYGVFESPFWFPRDE